MKRTRVSTYMRIEDFNTDHIITIKSLPWLCISIIFRRGCVLQEKSERVLKADTVMVYVGAQEEGMNECPTHSRRFLIGHLTKYCINSQ